ncbi:putative Ig domain-containing protein [Ruania halotolerans]|uniref:putative Ig domain-containing protein n=1 Tax=Ruania halotolerans TaxID=2897773 RepID=UPI001E379B21|nr:putative Ig domain-containing protein [Ruania halotolerans]UFU05293.1 LPXTG cell wall anchor domain-containing protein [Ruania halotolerans]
MRSRTRRTRARIRVGLAALAAASLVALGVVVTAPSASAIGAVVIDDFNGATLGSRTVDLSPAMGGTQATTFSESGGAGVFSIGGQGTSVGSATLTYAMPGPTDLTEGWTNTRISFPFESIQRTPDDPGTALSFGVTLVDADGNSDSIFSGIASTTDFDASFPLRCESAGAVCFEGVDATRISTVILDLRAPGNLDPHSVSVRLAGLASAPPVGTPTGPLTPTVTTPSTEITATAPRTVAFTVSFASDGFAEATTALSADDIEISGTAAGRDAVAVSGGPASYTVTVGPLTSSGTVGVSVPADAVTGLAGRPNIASTGEPEVTFTLGEVPAFASVDTAAFTAGEAGSFTIEATGSPVPAISVQDALPDGLAFTDTGDGTASISGTPHSGSGGTYDIGLIASNGFAPDATQTLTVTVNEAPVFTSADAVTFTAGQAGEFVVAAEAGFPEPVSIATESVLPEGMTWVDNGDGTATLAGTPSTGGEVVLSLVAINDAGLVAEQELTVTVYEAPVFTSSDTMTFVAGVADEFIVTTRPGFPEATTITTSDALPAGLELLDNGDGTASLVGTPSSGGESILTLVATNDAELTAEQELTVAVNEGPVFTSADAVTFTAGQAGEFVVAAEAGFPEPVSIATESVLPEGMTWVDNGDGTATLAGTPSTGGEVVLSLVATNDAGLVAEQELTVTVLQSPVLITEPNLALVAGVAGELTIETEPGYPGQTSLALTGDLPTGIAFVDHGDGTATLSGVAGPESVGDYPITVTATNAAAPDAVGEGAVTVALADEVALPDDEPAGDGTLDGVPAETTVGQEITVTGTGFAAGAPVTLGMYSEPTALGSATADDSGVFTATVVIPDTLGEHLVVAAGVSESGDVQFLTAPTTVSPVPTDDESEAPAPGAEAPELPTTGAMTDGLSVLAVLLTALGAVLLRRRQQSLHA